MTESESSELEKFQKTARSIRSSSDYSVPLGIIGKYLGLPASVTDYEIEALLIAATREKFKESLDADMALMALGLLKEFPSSRDSSENRSGIDLITVRRKKFIWTSSYIADRHSSSNKRRKVFYESCEDLEAAGEDAIKAVVKALNTEDGDAINAVAQKLYSKKVKINEYLDEVKEYLIYDKKGNIVDVKLQELKNTRQELTDDGNEDGSVEPNPPEPPTLEPDNVLIKITNWIKRFSRVVIVAILLLVVVLLIKPISLFLARLTESPRPYSIEFERTGRWLPYGEDMKLEVKPEPADASLEGLRCGSKGDNAHMIEVLSEQNLHIKAVKESEDSERCPVDIEAYMDYNENIKDVMTIYIIKDGQNESTGEGEIHDKSSGDYSQKAD